MNDKEERTYEKVLASSRHTRGPIQQVHDKLIHRSSIRWYCSTLPCNPGKIVEMHGKRAKKALETMTKSGRKNSWTETKMIEAMAPQSSCKITTLKYGKENRKKERNLKQRQKENENENA